MLARRLALVAALAALLALVAFFVMRDDGAIERTIVDANATPSPAEAAGTELVAADASATREDVATTLRSASIGKTFADLVRPIASTDQTALTGVVFECYGADGKRRSARLDDEVFSADLARGGVWVLRADGRCSRVVDPAYVDEMRDGTSVAPIPVLMAASATLTLHFDPGADARAAIERFTLGMENEGSVHNWLVGIDAGERVDAIELSRALPDVESLARGCDDVSAAAASVARVLEAGFCPWEFADRSRIPHHDQNHVLGWATRVVRAPIEESVVFENVPADVRLALSLLGATNHTVARADGVAVPALLESGAVRARPIELRPAQNLALFVRTFPFCVVRGRLPIGTEPDPELALWCSKLAPHDEHGNRGSRMVSGGTPTFFDDGRFEWTQLDHGEFRLAATWRQVGGVVANFATQFELEPGGVHDLGVLTPTSAARLTIQPRTKVIGALVPDFERSGLVVRAVVRGPIRSDDPNAPRVGASSRSIELDLDEPTVLVGIAPGWYRVEVVQLVPRGTPPHRDPPPIADLHTAFEARTDPRLVLLANPGPTQAVEVGVDSHLDVDLDIGVGALLAVDLSTAIELPAPVGSLTARILRRDAYLERNVATSSVGASAHTPRWNLVPPGEWTLLVGAELLRSPKSDVQIVVARADITLAAGEITRTALVLEPAARVRYITKSDDGRSVPLDEFPWCERFVERRMLAEGAQLIDGLLPHSRYRIDERVIETGAPGSEVVLK